MGEGCIVRRGKRSWRLKFEKGTDDDGKRLIGYETVRGSKKDAKIRLTEILESRNKGSFVDRTAMTVGDYLGRWLADHAAHAVSRKTYERYSEIVEKHLVPALGAKNLSDLKPLAIQAYYSQALTEGRRDGKGGGLAPRDGPTSSPGALRGPTAGCTVAAPGHQSGRSCGTAKAGPCRDRHLDG